MYHGITNALNEVISEKQGRVNSVEIQASLCIVYIML